MRHLFIILISCSALPIICGCGGEPKGAIKQLKSSNPEVVSKAVFYAAKRKDDKAVPELMNIVKGSMISSVKIEAVTALGKIGDKSAVDVLIALLKSDNADMRVAAADALGRIGDARAVYPLINNLEDKESQMTALWALGKIGDAKAEPVLAALLQNGDKYVSYGASRALRMMGSKE